MTKITPSTRAIGSNGCLSMGHLHLTHPDMEVEVDAASTRVALDDFGAVQVDPALLAVVDADAAGADLGVDDGPDALRQQDLHVAHPDVDGEVGPLDARTAERRL